MVSIIIGNYNYGRYIREAIESTLSQTYSNTEVIVVDDGSTDNSREIIKEYKSRLNVIFKQNGGQASAFNEGFSKSSGQVILFLDSDDVLTLHAIATVVPFFRDPDIVKVHWPLSVIDGESRLMGITRPTEPLQSGDFRELVFRTGPGNLISSPTSGNAWSRKLLEKLFPIPRNVYRHCADRYLFELALFLGSIGKCTEPLSLYREHGLNYTLRNTFTENFQRELNNYKDYRNAASQICDKLGIKYDANEWRENSWWLNIELVAREISELVPRDGSIILVDDGTCGFGPFGGRFRFPFTECNGHYNGPPADDLAAIDELGRLRSRGASHIAFIYISFWWLESYSKFAHYLQTEYREIQHNSRLVTFDLSKASDHRKSSYSGHP